MSISRVNSNHSILAFTPANPQGHSYPLAGRVSSGSQNSNQSWTIWKILTSPLQWLKSLWSGDTSKKMPPAVNLSKETPLSNAEYSEYCIFTTLHTRPYPLYQTPEKLLHDRIDNASSTRDFELVIEEINRTNSVYLPVEIDKNGRVAKDPRAKLLQKANEKLLQLKEKEQLTQELLQYIEKKETPLSPSWELPGCANDEFGHIDDLP